MRAVEVETGTCAGNALEISEVAGVVNKADVEGVAVIAEAVAWRADGSAEVTVMDVAMDRG